MGVWERGAIYASRMPRSRGTQINKSPLPPPPQKAVWCSVAPNTRNYNHKLLEVNVFSPMLRFQEFHFRNAGRSIVGPGSRWVSLIRFHAGRERRAAENGENYYNERVARGWESKSVEGQQADAKEKPAQGRPRLSAEEAARWRERESLGLSRQRVLQQLEASPNPRHRKLLEEALADLDEKLEKADSGPKSQS